MERSDVEDVVLHMCAFGLKSWDEDGEGLVKKPTRVLTNLPSIATALSRKCTGDHRHVHLMSGKAKAAAQYTEDFCSAIIDGVQTYLECLLLVEHCGAMHIDMGGSFILMRSTTSRRSRSPSMIRDGASMTFMEGLCLWYWLKRAARPT